MAKKSTAELIYTAYLTGKEAEFTVGNKTYTFTPEGLKDYIAAEEVDLSGYIEKASVANIEPLAEEASQEDVLSTLNALITALKG